MSIEQKKKYISKYGMRRTPKNKKKETNFLKNKKGGSKKPENHFFLSLINKNKEEGQKEGILSTHIMLLTTKNQNLVA